MRLLWIVLFVGCAFAAPTAKVQPKPTIERLLSDALREVLERFRQLMITGDPDRDIPIMDPLQMDHFEFEFDSNLLSMQIVANDIIITGASDFDVHNVDMSMIPLALHFDCTLPMTIIKSETYDFKGLVFGALPIYGNGRSYFEVGNLYFKGSSAISVGTNGVQLRSLDLEFHLGSLHSETNGMLGGGDIDNVINAMIADLAPDFINKNSEGISNMVADFFLSSINVFLEGMTLDELIDLVTGGNQK